MHKYAVFIGRFQPFHNGHLMSVRYGLSLAKTLIIVIGGYRLARSTTDPWTAVERKKMILSSLKNTEKKRIKFIFIRDRIYNEDLWKENLINEVNFISSYVRDMIVIGHQKDASSYYLKIFPDWQFIETGNFSNLNATEIRQAYLHEHSIPKGQIPNSVSLFLNTFKKSSNFKNISSEYFKIINSKIHKENESSIQNSLSKMLIRYGHYILFKKRKFGKKILYELPNADVNNMYQYQNFLICTKSFYCKKYDTFNKDGRMVSYYKIPLNSEFDMRSFKKSQFKWMILDELNMNEEKFFADYFQITSALIA